MADKKISDFTAATTVAAIDLIEIETAAGNSRKVTGTNFANSMATLSVRGALVKKSADQTGANYSGGVVVGWNAEIYDTDSIHDNATNNSRLTVPSGVSYVRVLGQAYLNNVASNSATYVYLKKNGSQAFDGSVTATRYQATLVEIAQGISSPILAVTAGDYFEMFVSCADTSIDILAAYSWFAMEIIG